MYKLLINCPHPEDGTSLYRAFGPLPLLQKDGLLVSRIPERVSWADINAHDAVFLQRAFLPEQVILAEMAKSFGKKVWVDYDDDLTTVPTDNPTHAIYSQQFVHDNVQKISRIADVVTVSTEFLKQKISKHTDKRVIVVPNGFTPGWGYERMSEDVPRNPVIVWRGSHCHVRDIWEHTEIVKEVYKNYPQYAWCFFGYNPWWITDEMDKQRYRYVQFNNDFVSYMRNLQKMRGAINIVPLVDSEFNRAKSDIAHLEASFAGSASLIPDWEEWQGGETFKYKNKKDFRDQLIAMIETPIEKLGEINNRDWNWVINNRTVEHANKLRRGVIAMLMGGM
jgi:hypothetical protein